MLGVRILCVGKLKERYWREAVAEYEKRLGAFCRLEILELPEARLPQDPSPGEIKAALEKEGAALLEKAAGVVYPLCIEGRQLDSPGLGKLLGKAMDYPGQVSFVIGSSFGLADKVKQAGQGFSMSPMTFPHQLARVMLCEQIYRGFQILGNTRYHK